MEELYKKIDKISDENQAILLLLPLIPQLLRENAPGTSNFQDGVERAMCNTAQKGGCMRNAMDESNASSGNGPKLDSINTAINALDLSLLAVIDKKLGPQISPNGISGKLIDTFDKLKDFADKSWKALGLDRVVSLLTLAVTIHNAAMLSRSLAETLVETAELVIQAAQNLIPGFLTNPDGKPFEVDLKEIFSKKIEDFLKATLGKDNYYQAKANWIRANRILTATSNILSAMHGMFDATINGLNTIGSWVALGFNGIQREGLVSDKTWPWMSEQPRFQNKALNKFTQKLEDTEQATDSIQQIAGSAITFVSESKEATEAATELTKALKADSDKMAKEEEKKDKEAEDEVD
jgi:hypothetical protein